MLPLILAAAIAASAPLRPDPHLTPGVVNSAATVEVICVKGYTSRPGVRHVTEATKAQVFAEYGVDRKSQHFEIDHLISLELGGANDVGNLWPESYDTQPVNAHVKDGLENQLHALVCAGKVPLAQAQKDIASDWRAAFVKYVGPLPTEKN